MLLRRNILFQQKNTRPALDKISRIFKKILPIYWAFLSYMLLKPGIETGGYWFIFQGIDKLVHISTFVMLGFCFMTAFPKTRFIIFLQIMMCYTFLTEILQDEMGLGRSLEVWDAVADTIGVLIGYLLFRKTRTFVA